MKSITKFLLLIHNRSKQAIIETLFLWVLTFACSITIGNVLFGILFFPIMIYSIHTYFGILEIISSKVKKGWLFGLMFITSLLLLFSLVFGLAILINK